MTNLLEKATEIEEKIIGWRRAIHQNPELGFEEIETAKLVATALNDMGLEAEVGVGRTGVVARIGNGNGRKIGIRADMDALPIHEAVDLPFKSQVAGKMHACGHDAHTAMLLGVAQLLHDEDAFDGEIRLLFQPSEERRDENGISGATAMQADGAIEGLDSVIAVHVDSLAPSGQIAVSYGNASAAADMFTAKILGEGTHGAFPHRGIDPIFIQAQVINAIQAIRSRFTDPTSASVISLGSIHAGEAPNVIPHEVLLTGTVRTFDEAIRDQVHEELDKAFQIARVFGGDYELDIDRGYPPMWNTPAVSEVIQQVGREFVGDDMAVVKQPGMYGEDFSYMLQKAPGAMFSLGARYDDQLRPHHSPFLALNEDSFKYGTAVLAETALRLLKSEA